MDKKANSSKQTFGIGYTTIIMIFVIICLSILALLSYNAAGINESLAENNRSYITSYYSAEARVTEKIAALDGIAYESAQSLFFEESFEQGLSQIADVACVKAMDGYNVSFSEKINDRLSLSVILKFFLDPSLHGGKRYTVEEYKTVGTSESEEENLGVWDGVTPIGG